MKNIFQKNSLSKELDAQREAFPAMGATLPASLGHPPAEARQLAEHYLPENKWTKKRVAKTAATLLAVVVIAGIGWTGYKFASNLHKITGGNIFDLLSKDKLRGEDRGRVNILLAGYSADDPGHGGAELTDSIMIVSIDTQNNTGFMLSIPRDLYVDIPGWRSYSKVNAVYQYGKTDGDDTTEDGMKALESVVEENFGLTLDYYALINYTALRDAVNAVGGITVNIDSDDPRGLYDGNISVADGGPLDLENGLQDLDGQTALNLARARGSTYNSYGFAQSDFTRTEHQRMMLVALKHKAASAGTLSNPLKLGKLFDSLGNNVETNFKTKELRRLTEVSQKVPDNKIKSISLNNIDGKNKNLLASYRTQDGQSALIPALDVDDYTDIQLFIKSLTDVDPQAQSSK